MLLRTHGVEFRGSSSHAVTGEIEVAPPDCRFTCEPIRSTKHGDLSHLSWLVPLFFFQISLLVDLVSGSEN